LRPPKQLLYKQKKIELLRNNYLQKKKKELESLLRKKQRKLLKS